MALHLNLEEQEQIAQIKGFWEQYGRLIIFVTVLLVAVIGGFATWQYWQNKQAQAAAALYDQFDQAVMRGDSAQAKSIVTQIQTEYGKTGYYGSQSALVASLFLYNKGELDSAKDVLTWVVENGNEPGLKALAVLRLADILTEQKNYDQALTVLATKVPDAFVPLVENKRGNVFLAQGKTSQAQDAFIAAYKGLSEQPQYREIIAGKLGLLGVDVTTLTAAGGQG